MDEHGARQRGDRRNHCLSRERQAGGGTADRAGFVELVQVGAAAVTALAGTNRDNIKAVNFRDIIPLSSARSGYTTDTSRVAGYFGNPGFEIPPFVIVMCLPGRAVEAVAGEEYEAGCVHV